MIILEFVGQTRVLNAPPDWNKNEPIKCGMLPIFDDNWDGTPVMVSFWKPTLEELAQLNAGSHVQLAVFGRGHPPVALCVHKCEALIERNPKDQQG